MQTEREKIAHLLRRFGLGASEAELEYYGKNGLKGAIDLLLEDERVEEKVVPLEAFRNAQNNNLNIQGLQAWWTLKLVSTRKPLREKMTIFWHDHFATSAQKVTAAMMMAGQNEILRENALGRFQTLLGAVSKDPAMLFWLDNQFNVKGKPNENFAREVMELFTIGIGHYSEKDVQEAARAFTGWTIRRQNGRQIEQPNGRLPRVAQFRFVPALHDDGPKTVLENTAPLDGDDVLGILCGHPRTALYLTEKIWSWFVYENPEAKTVEKFAAIFRDSGLDIKRLLRAIMESEEFYSAKAMRAIYKSPVDFCIATLRQLGVGEALVEAFEPNAEGIYPRGRLVPIAAANQAMKSMGMELCFPPDVSGWETGQNWITSATMVERISWADRLFPTTAPTPGSRRAVLNYPIFGLISDRPTAQNLVDTMLSLFDVPDPAAKRGQLLAAAQKHGATYNAQTVRNAANAVAKLIFGSPDFQFA